MPDKFCTQCGQRINLEDRFCIYCGAQAVMRVERGAAGHQPSGIFPRDRTNHATPSFQRGSRQAEDLPEDADDVEEDEADDYLNDDEDSPVAHVITEHQLNYLITCSHAKAPLDSYALLVREREGGYQWKPASAIRNLKSEDRIDCAWIYFNVGGSNFDNFCLDELSRDELSEDAWNRIVNWSDVIQLEVTILFKPMRHELLDNEKPGKWVKVKGDRGNIYYEAISHLPITGEVLRRKLETHADFLKEGIQKLRQRGDDATSGVLAEYEKTLDALEKTKKLIPNGQPDYIYCQLHPPEDAVIKLDDELTEGEGSDRAVMRVPSAVRGVQAMLARQKLLAKKRKRRSSAP
jgi:hypothetical protein